MKNIAKVGLAALMVTSVAGSALAQKQDGANRPSIGPAPTTAAAPATKDSSDKSAQKVTRASLYRPAEINHIRPADQRGVNMFEAPKEDQVPYSGFALSFGGAFKQDFQGLDHQNSAQAVMTGTPAVNSNQLIGVGHGFNTVVANLNVNAQIAPGIRVAMTSYLSARHHQESWVKDGYLLVDASPIDNPLLNEIMKYTTLRVGHFEINYGDSHFRRSDNGNGMYNPFVGNYIVDAFTTEIGAEVYARSNGLIAMLGATGGEIHGQVASPGKHTIGVLGKLGFDNKFGDNVRVRLTGSFYANNKALSSTIFQGDRGGSPYYDIMENTASTETAQAWSGGIRPGFSNKINAEVINPFIKIGGAEFFGNFETATGGSFTEPKMRTLHQNVYEGLYRLGSDEQFYFGARYNTLKGQLISKNSADEEVNRWQLGGGWFVTPNVLAKLEWVNQKYVDFPLTDIRAGGQFKGFMVSGVVGF